MSIVFAGGDIGGARVLMPVIEDLSKINKDIFIIPHRDLNNIVSLNIKRADIDKLSSEDKIKFFFKKEKATVFVFSTSVKDLFPLRLSGIAKENGVKVICILDNWVNYKRRLQLDDNIVLPDKYIVMDKFAYDEAVKDGIPEDILYIGGQPALSGIFKEYKNYELINNKYAFFKNFRFDEDKKLLLFISEPAESDQGNENSTTYRGYTEKTVLVKILSFLQNYKTEFQLFVKPHPREETDDLKKIWDIYSNNLEGGILEKNMDKDIVYYADGIIGMASILLYEAWLVGKPVISIQPNLKNKQLEYLKDKLSPFFIDDEESFNDIMNNWLKYIGNYKSINKKREELKFHENASDRIIKIINKYS